MVSEPTSKGTVGRDCSPIVLVPNLHPGDSLLCCILFYVIQSDVTLQKQVHSKSRFIA